MHDLYTFEQTGVNDRNEAEGYFHASGIRPQCLTRLQKLGIELTPTMFERGPRDAGRFATVAAEALPT
jgi:pilus assembly protein CpaF